jgi:hypothetical protein
MSKPRLAFLAVAALIGDHSVQAATCSITDVNYILRSTGVKGISLGFLPGLKASPDDLKNARLMWTIIDLSTNSFASVPTSEISAIKDVLPSAAELTPDFELDPKHSYLLTVKGIPGCAADEPLSAKITIQTPLPPVRAASPDSSAVNKPTGRYVVLTPSKTRTDSDIYISGLINGAMHQKAAYTADLKAQLNYIVKTARPESGWSPELSVIPNFDFTASTSRGSDGNSVSIGAFLRVTSPASAPVLLRHEVFEPGFAFQTDKYFRAKTPLFRLPIYFTTPIGEWRNTQFYVQPLMGLEVGGYSSLPAAKEYATAPAVLPSPDTVLRPFAGMTAYYFVYAAQKPLFSLQGDFIRRWPVIGEPNYSQDINSQLTLINVGRDPRDHLTLKAQRDLTQYFGFTLQFDYGRLPPLYTLVDHKYSVAITYKAGLKSGVR